ncbi:MAG: molecular chaperone DnaJ [Hyphomicrobiales bacterium]|nr:MAG: molecular chaperone DnaJ [Hyphomicrobiales bacterium]
MKRNSKYFDRIRIKPDPETPEAAGHRCEWGGCDAPAPYKAPKGRGADGQYHHFCLQHVRLYNKSYNYFDGMADQDVASYQRDAVTGHRPTWAFGSREHQPNIHSHKVGRDAFGLFDHQPAPETEAPKPRRRAKPLERKSFRHLELDETASAEQIRSQYKLLVKRHHPDANGGSRQDEDRLREIIDAYRHLRSVGFC